ncbi:MAG: 7-cyano-7-deazaguanine synthase [Nitrospirae bacterium]|nr:7-cyano-7-deazaguanine synthase [Nitrospirota bacterium]
MTKPVLVLLSGGVDSSVLLYWTLSLCLHPRVLDFQYPGRLEEEAQAAARVSGAASVGPVVRIDLPFVDAPKEEHSAYIPKRNLIYYGIAASIAEQWEFDTIYGGHIDPDGRSFSDARADFFDALNSLIAASSHTGSSRPCRVETPFIRKSKADVIRLGRDLGVPFDLTWSCLRDGPIHCRSCSSCRERRDGFRSAGVDDPLALPAA